MDHSQYQLLMQYLEKKVAEITSFPEQCVVFISFSDGNSRAHVVKGFETSYVKSFEKAYDKMEQIVKKSHLVVKQIKVDWVTQSEEISYPAFKNEWLGSKLHYYRKGFSLDPFFKLSFLEEEVNANAFVYEEAKTKAKKIHWKNIHHYIYENTRHQLVIDERLLRKVIVFDTASFYYDGSRFVDLSSESYFHGQRKCSKYNQATIYEKIASGSDYLQRQMGEDGRFIYGIYPYFDREIDHYNILRHCSSIYAMIESYEVTKSSRLISKIEVGMRYFIENAYYEVLLEDGSRRGYIRELLDNREIKLGANAAALLTLCKYHEVFGTWLYEKEAHCLAEGILDFWKEGKFVHVLDEMAEKVIDPFRIIYYDGEAIFALMRFYESTGLEKWLDFSEKAFEVFYQKNYEKFADHWLSYASYFLFKHRPNQRLYEFNLMNASNILEFASTRETTFATLLELFMATHRLLEHNESLKTPYNLPEWFDLEAFYKVVDFRVLQGFSGYVYPEVAMYFKAPNKILGAFYIRHHSFRIRIDDVEHALSGYCQFYHAFNQIKQRRK